MYRWNMSGKLKKVVMFIRLLDKSKNSGAVKNNNTNIIFCDSTGPLSWKLILFWIYNNWCFSNIFPPVVFSDFNWSKKDIWETAINGWNHSTWGKLCFCGQGHPKPGCDQHLLAYKWVMGVDSIQFLLIPHSSHLLSGWT